jgi:hypothetical protein
MMEARERIAKEERAEKNDMVRMMLDFMKNATNKEKQKKDDDSDSTENN